MFGGRGDLAAFVAELHAPSDNVHHFGGSLQGEKYRKLKRKGLLLIKALPVRTETALRVNSGCLELLETSERAGCGRK